MKQQFKKLKFNVLKFFGLVQLSKLEYAEESRDKLIDKIKDMKGINHVLRTKLNVINKKLKEPYPQHRMNLKKHSGQEIELRGVYIMSDGRGVLVRYLDHDKTVMCDHLWFKELSGQGLEKGDLVKVKGTVCKYGSMSYQKALTEDYGLYDVTIERITNDKHKSNTNTDTLRSSELRCVSFT